MTQVYHRYQPHFLGDPGLPDFKYNIDLSGDVVISVPYDDVQTFSVKAPGQSFAEVTIPVVEIVRLVRMWQREYPQYMKDIKAELKAEARKAKKAKREKGLVKA